MCTKNEKVNSYLKILTKNAIMLLSDFYTDIGDFFERGMLYEKFSQKSCEGSCFRGYADCDWIADFD